MWVLGLWWQQTQQKLAKQHLKPEELLSAGGQVKERTLKMSTLLDQGDDSELIPASKEQIDNWLSSYVSIMGNVPQEEEEPSEARP